MLVPVPDVVVPPGLLVNVHVPVAGKPLRATLPVGTVHVGCVMVPTTGTVGGVGTALITTAPDAEEVHPEELVTVNEYDPGARPIIVVLVPVPFVVVPPGVLVNVHVPVEGSPLSITLPEVTTHVG